MPQTFRHYSLPAAAIPVFYKTRMVSTVDIPKDGGFATDLDEGTCRLIKQGGAVLKFRAEFVVSGKEREKELIITSIEIEHV
jgi:hypothetical protein